MLKYIIRRILYMIPTILGVILITFVLFNIAGGDPAMMKLGKNATPRAMEDYDLQRGYDKPLFYGSWGTSRVYGDSRFDQNAGPWSRVEGVAYTNTPPGRILLRGKADYAVPLAFNLQISKQYRWEVVWRMAGTAAGSSATFLLIENSNVVKTVALTGKEEWNKTVIEFVTGGDTSRLKCQWTVERGTLEIRSLKLRRHVRHPFDSQLFFYLGQIGRCDFGESAETNQRVSRMILSGILPSLALTVPMFLVGLLVEIALALFCAFFRDTFVDRFFVVFSVILMSVNYLVWIVFGQYFLGYVMRWFPVWGFESWRYLVLPCMIGVFSGLGSGIRFYRTIMLDEMYRDYVRTAFAKGVSRSGVLFKHVLKNAMIPILTSVVMAIPFLYTGSLLLESFFGIPGLGNLAINGILNSDVDVIRAVVLVGSVIYVIANLITDICYTLVDPRVKLR
jgi:peptide/nickel transport system permease protein